MPRPGPRPYECIRRAWHSERHQPMRGLIIQQIFRLAHDNHCAGTKKNREWLEKLPIVVLKSEEIMYSKANSEVEYSNLETLWDRVNEAVDTIIRKDESTETGGLLPPCVEAALNLGCVPVRASRSQRNNNPRPYLRPINQECNDASPNVSNENAIEHQSKLMPPHTANISMFKIPPTVHSPRLVLESNKRLTLDTNKGIAASCEKLPCTGNSQSIEMGFNTSLNIGSVYPLYYDTNFKPKISQLSIQEPRKSDSIIVGVPIFSSAAEPAEVVRLQNLFPYAADKSITQGTSQADSKDNNGKEPQTGCDLSLRLGLFSGSNSSREHVSDCGTDSVVRRVFQDRGQSKVKESHLFPVESTSIYDPSRLHTSCWNSEVENPNTGVVCRKRKLPVTGDVDDDLCFWSRDPTSNHFAGQVKRPDQKPSKAVGKRQMALASKVH